MVPFAAIFSSIAAKFSRYYGGRSISITDSTDTMQASDPSAA